MVSLRSRRPFGVATYERRMRPLTTSLCERAALRPPSCAASDRASRDRSCSRGGRAPATSTHRAQHRVPRGGGCAAGRLPSRTRARGETVSDIAVRYQTSDAVLARRAFLRGDFGEVLTEAWLTEHDGLEFPYHKGPPAGRSQEGNRHLKFHDEIDRVLPTRRYRQTMAPDAHEHVHRGFRRRFRIVATEYVQSDGTTGAST